MAPQAITGETLADRSQRILGVALDSQTGSENGTKSRRSNVSPSRRREQVAQAQRKHRQRTQKYIRELENEVIRLRNNEKTLIVKNSNLQTELDLYRDALALNGIPVPVASSFQSPAAASSIGTNFESDFGPSQTPGVKIDLTSLSGMEAEHTRATQVAEGYPVVYNSPFVNVDLTELSRVEPERACCILAAESPPRVFDSSNSSPIPWVPPVVESQLLQTTAYVPSPNAGATGNGQLLNAQSAIDFILKLEQACLPHLKFGYINHVNTANVGDPPYHSGPSHAFNASTSIFYDHLAQNPATQSVKVSTTEIDRLLDASRHLNLEDEYTPVQVWSMICSLSATHPVTIENLTLLADECSKYTYCNSFGSVIDKSIVAAIFQNVFASSEIPSVYVPPTIPETHGFSPSRS